MCYKLELQWKIGLIEKILIAVLILKILLDSCFSHVINFKSVLHIPDKIFFCNIVQVMKAMLKYLWLWSCELWQYVVLTVDTSVLEKQAAAIFSPEENHVKFIYFINFLTSPITFQYYSPENLISPVSYQFCIYIALFST